jgi:predicted Fe-Mo cluster-binding NifX family protein
MRVAVPLFGSRVSPRFDCGSVLLLAEVSGGVVGPTEQVADQSANALERVARLRQLGVDAVICGAITMFLWRHLVACGIEVFPWAFCESAEALEALARGELRAEPMQRGRGRMRRRGRRKPG